MRADVRNCSRWMGTVHSGVEDWEPQVLTHWPHLVVIQFGIVDANPILIPRVVHRQAWGMQRTDGLVDRAVTSVLRTNWPLVHKASQRLDRPWIRGHVSGARFGRQFRRLVDQTLDLTAADVVVIGMHPPNFRLMKLGTAYPARRARMQRIITEAVADRPRCGYVDFQRVLDAVHPDFEKSLPDGIHLVAEAHRVLARLIADEYWAIEARRSEVQQEP
jgi:lysophospholipase L1-like esterase